MRTRSIDRLAVAVAAALLAGCGSTSTPAPAPSTPPPAPGSSSATPSQDEGEAVDVVAVGDIASSSGLDDAVASEVAKLQPDKLLLIGDVAYDSGSTSDFASYFAPDWSRFASIWMPVPGNHEYRTPNAAGYRAFFNLPTGPLYSAQQVGSWLVIGLDSDNPSGPGDQLPWLASQLAAHDGQPTLVMWHRARFSSGEHGDQVDTEAFWSAIKGDPDVQLVLWAHDHDYERMSVPVDGRAPIPAMVVGTGGGELRPTPAMIDRPWRELFVDHATGILDLHLAADSFTWSFINVAGQELDSGSHALTPGQTP